MDDATPAWPHYLNAGHECSTCSGSGDEMEDSLTVLGVHGGEDAIGPCPSCVGGWVSVPTTEPCGCGQSGGPEAYRAPSGTIYCCPVCGGTGSVVAPWASIRPGDPVIFNKGSQSESHGTFVRLGGLSGVKPYVEFGQGWAEEASSVASLTLDLGRLMKDQSHREPSLRVPPEVTT